MRVEGFGQLYLLLSPPSFKLLLTINCLPDVIIRFPAEQAIDFVLARKSSGNAPLVLPDTFFWAARHANVQGSRQTTQDVQEVSLSFSHGIPGVGILRLRRSCAKRMTGFAQNDMGAMGGPVTIDAISGGRS
jgi:hypothetical protein